jgi:amino acid adenylation domain-containing protein/thioester reductase-like protein
LFDVVMVVQNYRRPDIDAKGIRLRPKETESANAKFDLTLFVEEEKGQVHVQLEYCTRLFKPDTIRRLSRHLRTVIGQVVASDRLLLGEIELMDPEERRQVVLDFNRTAADYPAEKSLFQLFGETVARFPDRVALVADGQLTYSELLFRVERLACALKTKGAAPGSVVALYLPRSIDMMCAIMAVSRAGCGYLPLDPQLPAQRISYMLNDGDVRLALSRSDMNLPDSVEGVAEVVNVDEHRDIVGTRQCLDAGGGKDLAYVIYTSGTTGRPKGTMITHANVSRIARNTNYIEIDERDRLLQLSNYAFDGSVFDIFASLLNGAALVMVKKADSQSAANIALTVQKNAVTVFLATTALFNILVEYEIDSLRDVRTVIFGGETSSVRHVRKALDHLGPGRLVHMYGPTESTVYATYYPVEHIHEHCGAIPIGKPISNTTIYILDPDLRPLPKGIFGELYIGGAGLGIGYLNNPALTREKFVPHPFLEGEILYKTGDLGRFLEDGNVEFLGRGDLQVKIRGFRIELQEIEALLAGRDDIVDAVVTVRGAEHGDRVICAYFTASKPLAAEQLREALSLKLPHYMVPAHFVQLDRLPLTPNGKVDRKALPEPQTAAPSHELEPPRTELEQRLAVIWAEALAVEPDAIGCHSNFFHLGGHSLKATVMLARIHKELSVKIPLAEIFETQTLSGLAEYVARHGGGVHDTIPPAPAQEYYRQSSAQTRLFLLDHLENIGTTYNAPFVFVIEGQVDRRRLTQTFEAMIRRHESLRTSFLLVDNQPVQQVHDEVEFLLQEIALPGADLSDSEIKRLAASFIRPFELSKPPLLRAAVGVFEEQERLLFLDMHHIATDGTSVGVFLADFMTLYRGESPAPLAVQYKDFAHWERRRKETGAGARQEAFWLEQFKGEIPVLDLPTDFPRPRQQTFSGNWLTVSLDEDLTNRVKAFAVSWDATLFMVLLAALNVLLAKIGGEEDVVVGSPIAARQHADLQPLIGMFVNTLALRNFPESGKRFGDFLQEVKERSLQAFENQEYQFEDLVRNVAVARDAGRNPLFDVMLVLQNMDIPDVVLPGASLRMKDIINPISQFDLVFSVDTFGSTLNLHIAYCVQLFKQETILCFASYFERILRQVIERPDVSLADIRLLDDSEAKLVLARASGPVDERFSGVTLKDLLEEGMDRQEEAVALNFHDQCLSYGELSRRSNQLARYLRLKGAGPGTFVALMVDRSFDMIIALLAIIKSGAAYLALDPTYPPQRLQFTLEDCGAGILLSRGRELREVKLRLEDLNLETILLEEIESTISSLPSSNPNRVSEASDLLYVLYTSGSTGVPKGIMMEHRNLVNILMYGIHHVGFDFSRILQFTSLCFDVSYQEIYSTLMRGGQLVLIDNRLRSDIPQLLRTVDRHKITTLFLPASYLKFVLNTAEYHPLLPKGIQHLVTAGEQLIISPPLRRYLQENHIFLHNHFGPSEAHVVCTLTLSPVGQMPELPPVGKPVMNSDIYLLDPGGNPVPMGVRGEVYVGGAQVGRGYLGRDDLTASNFIPNPFKPGIRLYRTGDLGRWLPDGNLEFLGRIDFQVKIRGYRIELGEIENQLLRYPAISDAVVLDRVRDDGERYLCAYFVAGLRVEIVELRRVLGRQLPEYMVPPAFVQLEEIPLNANRKVDRGALPEPVFEMERMAAPPENEVQEKVGGLWNEVLGIDGGGVDIDANFFEVGGHSLKATILASRIAGAFDVEFPLNKVFSNPTVRLLAEQVSAAARKEFVAIPAVEGREYYPQSSPQKRLYLLGQLKSIGTGYNVPAAFAVKGAVEAALLEKTLQALVNRHEALRTSFHLKDGEPVQRVTAKLEFSIENIHLSPTESVHDASQRFVRPFDLARAPLLRAALVDDGEGGRWLLLDFHHIIVDGTSIGVFLSDFMALANGGAPAPLPVQYKEYTLWLERSGQREEYARQERFWLESYADEPPVLDVPLDFPRPRQQEFGGHWLTVRFPVEMSDGLRQLALDEDVTLFMLLEASLSVLLAKLSGQQDIVLGTPVAARRHRDIQQVMGMFVNTLALRHKPEAGKSFRRFLREVKAHCLDAFANQEYQFDHLVDKVATGRDPSRNPLFDVMLVMQNMEIPQLRLPDLELEPVEVVNPISQFDLVFSGRESDGGLDITVCYCTALFKEDTVRRFVSYWQTIIAAVLERPAVLLGQIDVLSSKEREEVLALSSGPPLELDDQLTVHELFRLRSLRLERETALVHRDMSMNYSRLKQRAAAVAHLLRSRGVGAGVLVALMVHRSFDMICAMLGILEAGAAYLPVDPAYPAERVDYMLADSGARFLITSQEAAADCLDRLDSRDIDVLMLDQMDGILQTFPTIEPANLNNGDSNLYVIYTSGSTGKPKGVALEHRNLVNLLLYQLRFTTIDFSRVLQFTTICFDVSFQEIFSTLVAGGRLVLIDAGVRNDTTALFDVIGRNDVATLFLPTAFLKFLFTGNEYQRQLPGCVRHIVTAGEQLTVSPHLRDYLREEGVFLHNHYGPSETHVVTTLTLDPQLHIPDVPSIGTPVSNTGIYILDSTLKPVPLGVAGELCIGGTQVGTGYLGRPDLTADRFVPNPFKGGDRLYRSGDLARYRLDGSIEFLGRKDYQVKIRGYRVEPGEVENCLLSLTGVSEAVVIARVSGGGETWLAAYAASDKPLDTKELRLLLSKRLPDYMVPAAIQWVRRIPKLPNGKVDRKALPQLDDGPLAGSHYRAPRNAVEARIAEIWQETLEVGRVGIDDNLFEIGGNSLVAMKLVTRMAEEFEISFSHLFTHQTIARLAEGLSFKKDHLKGVLRGLLDQANGQSGSGTAERDRSIQPALREYRARVAAESRDAAFDPYKYKAVLLTGGTGFLGAHLAAQLTQTTNAVIFLLVREKKGTGAFQRFRDKMIFYFGETFFRQYEGRFKVIAGDVELRDFGLRSEEYRALAHEVEAVVHAAANVRHYGVYDDFERANVLGTRHVLDFASNGDPKDVHHISTTGVSMAAANGDVAQVFGEFCRCLSPNHPNVYVRSKVEAENLVFEFQRQGGNASIYRAGNLVGDSMSGRFQENIHDNAFYAYLKDAVQLGVLPETGETVDLTFVDVAAQAIVRLCFARRLDNEVFHIENHERLTFTRLAGLLGKASVTVDPIAPASFFKRLLKLLDNGDQREFPHRMLVHSGLLDSQSENGAPVVVESGRSRAILESLGFRWPGVAEDHVRRMSDYLRQVGFLE